MSWRNKSAFCPKDIISLKPLFTGYAEDKQGLDFLINFTAYLSWKSPVFQSNKQKLITQRLTLYKQLLHPAFVLVIGRAYQLKRKGQQLIPSKLDVRSRGRPTQRR